MSSDPLDDEPSAWDQRMAEHEKSLTVGTRVRVRLNGECEGGHAPEEHGITGVIDSMLTDDDFTEDNLAAQHPDDIITVAGLDHHVYSVTYDNGQKVPTRFLGVALLWDAESLYCAAELAPLAEGRAAEGETDAD